MARPTTSRGSSTGLPRGVQVGPLGARVIAYLLDHLLPALVVAAAALLASRLSGTTRTLVLLLAVVLVLAWAGLEWWMYAVRAAGPGMLAMKLQLVGLSDGRPIGWARFFLRWLVLTLLSATGVGLLLMIVFLVLKPRRQGWHDVAANSVVIKERMLAPPRAAPVVPAAVVAVPTQHVDAVEAPAPVLSEDAAAPPRPATPNIPPAAEPRSSKEAVIDTPSRLVAVAPHGSRPLDEGWQAVLDDGRTVQVTGLVLLGRNPTARPSEEDAQLIKIGDESRTVSKTHLALGVDANGLWVMDRGSTNGSTVTTQDGTSQPCEPGALVEVQVDSIVSFGDHWLQVRRP